MGRFHDYALDIALVSSLWAAGLGYVGMQHDEQAADLARSLDPALVTMLDAPWHPGGLVMSAASGSTGLSGADLRTAARYREDRASADGYDLLGGLLAAVGLVSLVVGGARIDTQTIDEARRALSRDTAYFGWHAASRFLDPTE